MMKIITILAAVCLIIVGLVVFPMPIPLGALMIVVGIVLLLSASVTAVNVVRRFRRRHPKADRVMREAEDRLPKSWKRILKRSDP